MEIFVTFELNDAFMCEAVPAEVMDALWSGGWRHFGQLFFRYDRQETEDGTMQTITPLRIHLEKWQPTKSQRRVLRRNEDLRWEMLPMSLDDDLRALFERHKGRFRENIPEKLENFVGDEPEAGPCDCRMLRVFEGDKLLAVSFLDMGLRAVSSVYAMFEPEAAWRSLGIFTMLLELQFARESGFEFLYPGYATHEASVYDYKKQFTGMEWLDFESGEWRQLPR
jgi:arginine-tRNA-protein transferase